jgi:hypothetical protein
MRKVINIEGELYKDLKKYCEFGGYKIAKFVERLISKEIYVDSNVQKMSKRKKLHEQK